MRPPGHHACRHVGGGFCLFNNSAIAAQYALESGLERVLIVDYDVHHGNGTQDIFYERDDVLYFSIHQYPNCPWSGHCEERGQGVGEGYTVNIPVPWAVGDAVYERVFQEVLPPMVHRYAPELILVSAGYDAHWSDPVGNPDVNMRLSSTGYHRLAETLLALAEEHCQGRSVFVLEGGYNPEALSHSVLATFAALLGEEAEDPLGPSPREEELSTFSWADYPAFRAIPLLSESSRWGPRDRSDGGKDEGKGVM